MRSSIRLDVLIAAALAPACQLEVDAGRVERCALGVHVAPSMALEPLEAMLDRPFDLERTFHQWDHVFPTPDERASAAAGRTIVASFNSKRSGAPAWRFAQLADPGNAEIAADLAAMAARVRELGQPIYLVFHDEANNDEALGTPTEFVAAWRRVVTAFRAAGADNAIFVWSLAASAYPSSADAWYPGDDYVDVIGATGFNWYLAEPASPWRTFASIFASFFEWSEAHRRPLMIVSTATGENPQADDARTKPTWILETLETLRATPAVQGVIWYSAPGDPISPVKDWRIDSSTAALAAFKELATDPHFDVTGVTPRDP
jgi:hypothetical protein